MIISITQTITILYCRSADSVTGKCLSCERFRYVNNNTIYGLCYPLNCRNNL